MAMQRERTMPRQVPVQAGIFRLRLRAERGVGGTGLTT